MVSVVVVIIFQYDTLNGFHGSIFLIMGMFLWFVGLDGLSVLKWLLIGGYVWIVSLILIMLSCMNK